MQMPLFMKNLCIAGACITLFGFFAYGWDAPRLSAQRSTSASPSCHALVEAVSARRDHRRGSHRHDQAP